MTYDKCPACDSENAIRGQQAIYCQDCHAVYGDLDPTWLAAFIPKAPMLADVDPERLQYFDFTVAGNRIHGWQDRVTRRVVQYG